MSRPYAGRSDDGSLGKAGTEDGEFRHGSDCKFALIYSKLFFYHSYIPKRNKKTVLLSSLASWRFLCRRPIGMAALMGRAGLNIRIMERQRIFVDVVGFTDVERHALNTVFRLSEERSLSYVLWSPMTVPGTSLAVGTSEVILVDGQSAEAVLLHAKALPPGQRLIWVGPDAPEQAWRVLQRPIQWADLLNDLDAVFAAFQVDSGLIDLDISAPAPLQQDAGLLQQRPKRALLAGSDAEERMYLRSRLALAGVVETDEVTSTELAIKLMGLHHYCCGVFNLDDHQIDAWSLARLFSERFPQALTMATSELAGPLSDWWNRHRVKRNTRRAGISILLARPLQPPELSRWMALL